MTPKERAAMQQALKAMKDASPYGLTFKEAITACGEVLAEQAEPNSTFMEGYRIGLAEMREKCATVSEQGTGEAVQKAALDILINERKRIAAAIRAIKFEGDTGFRPVSEMIAEHKQAEQGPVAIVNHEVGGSQKVTWLTLEGLADGAELYLRPVRTKDLTDDELASACGWRLGDPMYEWVVDIGRWAIAADRELNQ